MLVHVLVLLLGIAVLILGSDVAVGGASRLARRLNLSDLVVGLTVVAIGTSLPELATATMGALASGGEAAENAAGMAIGNVVGSNLFLLTALLGIAGLVRDLPVSLGSFRRDGLVLVAFTAILLFGFVAGTLTRGFGAVLVLAFGVYLAVVVRQELQAARERAAVLEQAEPSVEPTSDAAEEQPDWAERLASHLPVQAPVQDGFVAVLGLALVVWGATLVVDHGVGIAEILALPGTLIGVFVGAATSLPEIVVSARAASKGTTDIAVGNILGSSITNLGLCLGVAALAHPIPVSPLLLVLDYPFLAASTLMALLLMWEKEELSRHEGGVLLLLYALYLVLRMGISGA